MLYASFWLLKMMFVPFQKAMRYWRGPRAIGLGLERSIGPSVRAVRGTGPRERRHIAVTDHMANEGTAMEDLGYVILYYI